MKAYREREWEPVCSGPTELSISSYTEDYKRAGYETDLRHEKGCEECIDQKESYCKHNNGSPRAHVVRLYVRPKV